MKTSFSNNLKRLRLLALLEGISLLMLIFITMPLKYIWGIPQGSEIIGPIHGVLFILFVIYTIVVGIQFKWSWVPRIVLIILSSFVPFGTFIVDHKILKPAQES